jgi:hypothetical protein
MARPAVPINAVRNRASSAVASYVQAERILKSINGNNLVQNPNKYKKLMNNVAKTRNAANNSIHNLVSNQLNKELGKAARAPTPQAAVTAAANVDALTRVLQALQVNAKNPTTANRNKLMNLVGRLSRGNATARKIGNVTITPNLNQGIKNTLARIVTTLGNTDELMTKRRRYNSFINQLPTGLSNNNIARRVANYRNSNNKGQNLKQLLGKGNANYNKYLNMAAGLGPAPPQNVNRFKNMNVQGLMNSYKNYNKLATPNKMKLTQAINAKLDTLDPNSSNYEALVRTKTGN